ncbi:MAG: lycopene cyclase domain-containing protein [Ignavibacteria bacterium]
MMDYTILVIAGSLFVIVMDFVLRTRILRQRLFWVFWLVVTVLMVIVNGYLTWRPIVIYNEAKMLGVRLFTIPLEDFFFGFSLIGLNLIIWEYFNRKESKENN